MCCYTPMTAEFRPASKLLGTEHYLKFVPRGEHNIEIPCGKCLGCRLDRCGDWALRCMHEAQRYENNCFVTFTFKESPVTCDVFYFQAFMKRLRRYCDRQNLPSPRYFHSTEYGDRKFRPHHHAILFNYLPHDLVLFKYKKTGNLYTSETLSRLWGHGFVTIGAVTHDSAAYVAAYTINRDTSRMFVDVDSGLILEPEKMTCSRGRKNKKGEWVEYSIGVAHFKNFLDQYLNCEFIHDAKGRKRKIPRGYMRWLEQEFPEKYETLKENREQRAYEASQKEKLDLTISYKALLLRQGKYKKSLDSDFKTPTISSIRQFRRHNIGVQDGYVLDA